MNIENQTPKVEDLGLRETVARDLNKKLSEYRDPKLGTRLLSEKMGVSKRTLSRLLNCENRPTYQTLYKIYRAIFDSPDESILLDLVPEIVRNEIVKHNPNDLEKKINYRPALESEFLYDRVFAEIYFMAACSPVARELIQFRYGISGIETVERMVELKALKESKLGYILGENQVNFSSKVIKRVGLSIAEKFAKPKNSELAGENVIAFYAEGLSEEAYQKWLEIDEIAFHEKINISKEEKAKGDKRAFTYMVTDTFTEK